MPPHFWLVLPHFVCSGDGTGSNPEIKQLELLVYFAPVMRIGTARLRLAMCELQILKTKRMDPILVVTLPRTVCAVEIICF